MTTSRIVFIFVLILLLASSCSSKLRTRPEPIPIPEGSLIQNYSDVIKDDICGREPILRYVEFSYNTEDSLEITVTITTSIDEKPINGQVIILLDEYELTYAHSPNHKRYVETVEQAPTHNGRTSYYRLSPQMIINPIRRNNLPRRNNKMSKDQYWNSVRLKIQKEDMELMLQSKDLDFIIFTDLCELKIVPTHHEIKQLKMFLRR